MPITHVLGFDKCEAPLDRRERRRYPIRQDVRFKLSVGKVVVAGAGTTLDIASSGVLFTTDHALPIGCTVELSMNWPTSLNEACGLRFVASGAVVRSDGQQAAIRIQTYNFKTRSIGANRKDDQLAASRLLRPYTLLDEPRAKAAL